MSNIRTQIDQVHEPTNPHAGLPMDTGRAASTIDVECGRQICGSYGRPVSLPGWMEIAVTL